jgi:hypothetical protein
MSLQEYLRTDRDGIKYYELPKGFVLYRGDSDPKYKGIMVFEQEDTQRFFGFNQETTEEEYGITFEFKAKRQLNLLALDKNNTDKFLELVESRTDKDFDYYELLDILNKNYGYKTGTRDSVSKQDNILSSFIRIKLPEFDGYACDMMKKQEGGFFHAEAMICYPKDKLTEGKRVTKGNLNKYYDEWKLRKLGKEMEEQRVADRQRRPSRFFYQPDNTINSPVRRPLSFNTYDSPAKQTRFPDDTYHSPVGKTIDYDDTYNSPDGKTIDYDDDNIYMSPAKKIRLPKYTYDSPGGRGGKRKTKRKQRKTKRKQKKPTQRRKRQIK